MHSSLLQPPCTMVKFNAVVGFGTIPPHSVMECPGGRLGKAREGNTQKNGIDFSFRWNETRPVRMSTVRKIMNEFCS